MHKFLLSTSLLLTLIALARGNTGPSIDFVEAIEEVDTIAPIKLTQLLTAVTAISILEDDDEDTNYLKDHLVIEVADFLKDCGPMENCSVSNSTDGIPGNQFNVGRPLEVDFKKNPHICRCDLENCLDIGDCCYTSLIGQHLPKNRTNYWDCNKFHEKDTYVMMISQCPPESPSPLSNLCSANPNKDSPADYTYLVDIPVYSTNSNSLYRNIYCARCHGETNRHLVQWKTRLYCNVTMTKGEQENFIDNSKYVKGERYLEGQNRICAIYIADLLNNNVTIESIIPNVRYCSASINSCPEGYGKTDEEVKISRLCSSYSQIIRSRNNIFYKNPHCALCNGIQPKFWHIERNITSDNIKCHSAMVTLVFKFFPNQPSGPHGIQLLFDFSLDSHENVVGYNTVCDDNEIWDYLHKRCQVAVCRKGQILQDDSCLTIENDDYSAGNAPGDDNPENISSGPSGTIFHGKYGGMNSTCMRILLFEGEYSFIDKNNTSILINSSATNGNPIILHEFEYEYWNDTTLAVCAKQLHEGFMSRFSVVLNYVSMISLAISVFFSILHILLYMLLPKLRNLPGKNLLCLTFSLLISQFIFLTLINHSRWPELCVGAAVAVHYFYLAAFFWMNVMSFDMWRTFSGATILSRNQSQERKQITFLKYSLFSWFTPFVIVSIAILVEFLPDMMDINEQDETGKALLQILETIKPCYGQNGFCWIGQRVSLFVFFAAPVALIVISNLILFSLTARAILSQNKEAGRVLQNRDSVRAKKDMHGNSDVVKAKLYAKLALIMGLTWILGFISNFAGWSWLWFVFVLFNGLQGTFIFFAFDFKWKILEMVFEKFKRVPMILFFMKLCHCVKEQEELQESTLQSGKSTSRQSRSISFSGTISTNIESK